MTVIKIRHKKFLLLGPLIALCPILASCGGGSSSPKVASLANQTISVDKTGSTTPETAADFKTQLLAYAKCMRDNGADFPDPQFDANGRPQMNGDRTSFDKQRNDPTYQKADTVCQSKRPQFGARGTMTAEQQAAAKDSLLKFAKCMRTNGVDFPDPTFGSDGRPAFGASGPMRDVNRDDPAFQTAQTKCRTELGGTFGPGRGNGDGGPGAPSGSNTSQPAN